MKALNLNKLIFYEVIEIQSGLFVALIAILAVAAVWVMFSGMFAKGNGYLTLLFKDSIDTSNIQKINITVNLVKVHKEGTGIEAENETSGDDEHETNDTNEVEGDSEGEWITVVDTATTYNLLDPSIQTNPAVVFQGKTLPDGRYTQIRLNISKATLTFTNGTTVELNVPSQRYYWVRPFDVVQGKTTTLTLDFNASESIVQADGKLMFRPSVHITEERSE